MIFIYSQSLIHPFTDLLRTNTGIAKVMGRRSLIFFQALFSLIRTAKIAFMCTKCILLPNSLSYFSAWLKNTFPYPQDLQHQQPFQLGKSFTTNVPKITNNHHCKFVNEVHDHTKSCNWLERERNFAFLMVNDLTNNIIHKATATTYIRSFRSFIHKTLLIIMAEGTLLGCSK